MVFLVAVVSCGVGVVCKVCGGFIVSGEGFFLHVYGVWGRLGLDLEKGFSSFGGCVCWPSV